MRLNILVAGFALVFGSALAAAGELSTQARAPNESWEEVEERLSHRLREEEPDTFNTLALSARGAAVRLNQVDFSNLPEWDPAWAQEAFEKVRDLRFFYLPEMPKFLRRISWMYPDDGCFARAAYAGRKFAAFEYPRPRKLFIFGDLTVKTRNAIGGRAYWWYHVAPVVSIGGKPHVLDPSIEPDRPLPVRDWITRMTPNSGNALFSNCGPYAYAYYTECRNPSAAAESDANADEGKFLRAEWNRLSEQGRDPARELGENPPWKILFDRDVPIQEAAE